MSRVRRAASEPTLVGARVELRHGLLWLRRGVGTVRSTYRKEGRDFATVEVDGSGKVVLRLLGQLRVVAKRSP